MNFKMNLNENSYKDYINANSFYDGVMDRLGIPEEDLVFRLEVQFLFEKALSEHVSISTLELADDFHLNALLAYKSRSYEIAPLLTDSEIIMEFLETYSDLRQQVFATVPGFIDDFVSDFNKIFKTNGK